VALLKQNIIDVPEEFSIKKLVHQKGKRGRKKRAGVSLSRE